MSAPPSQLGPTHSRLRPFSPHLTRSLPPRHSRSVISTPHAVNYLLALPAHPTNVTVTTPRRLQDLAVRRRKTEVDQQIGLVAEIGATHGLPMPLTRALVSMIHELEDGRRAMSRATLDTHDTLRRTTSTEGGVPGPPG